MTVSGIMVLAEPSTVKVRNIRRDPRVALCISTNEGVARYVQVNGTASVSDEWARELLWAMSISYMGREKGEEYAKRAYEEIDFSLITVTPSRMLWATSVNYDREEGEE